MSGLMNKLGLGHKDAHHDDAVAREAGATHTATVENAAQKNGAATTTTTTTTTNQNATNATTGINSNAPYGASNSTSTARTGAAYSATGATSTINQPIQQQQTGVFTERSGIHGDDAMTRSEEQLRVAKATVETGKAELNKYVETQHVEQAVPVTRERVVIEREPITASNIGDALKGPSISEAHFETTLHEDRIAASKETVPIERIRLAKQTETHVESVGADLRKEHIDMQYTSLEDKVGHQSINQSGLHGSKIDTTSSTGLHGNKIDPLAARTATGTTTNTNTTRSAY